MKKNSIPKKSNNLVSDSLNSVVTQRDRSEEVDPPISKIFEEYILEDYGSSEYVERHQGDYIFRYLRPK